MAALHAASSLSGLYLSGKLQDPYAGLVGLFRMTL